MNLNGFQLQRKLRARAHLLWMITGAVLLLALPMAIGAGLFIKSSPLLGIIPLKSVLFGNLWQPSAGHFGMWPFLMSSVWVSVLSLAMATPVCLLSAIYLTQFEGRYIRQAIHPVIDILAGIPSVVYGAWGILVIVPWVAQTAAPFFGVQTTGYTILSAAMVLSVMIIPFMLNMFIDLFKTIPTELTEASLSLGATMWMTVKRIHLRKILPGIISTLLLSLSKAFGETMAVLMVVGNVARTPHHVFEPGYPIPALIANNYGEMLSIPLYDSALMLASLILFLTVIGFNVVGRWLIYAGERVSR